MKDALWTFKDLLTLKYECYGISIVLLLTFPYKALSEYERELPVTDPGSIDYHCIKVNTE